MEEAEEYEVNPERFYYEEEETDQALVRDRYFQKWTKAANTCMCVVGVRVRRPGKQVVCPIRYVRHTGASEHLVGGRSISLTSSEGWTKICECCPF